MFRIILTSLALATSMQAAAKTTSQSKGGPMTYQSSPYQIFDTKELMNAKSNLEKLIIVDSRTKAYDDGRRIQGALYLPADASEKEILSILPEKTQPIVVYCWSESCPASTWLIDRLVQLGYTNLYKYSEGLSIWLENDLPIEYARQP